MNEDMEDLPSFFAQKSHIPEGVSSLIGELEDAGLLEDEDDENLEMNMETFGAASMAEIEQFSEVDNMMSLEEIEAGFNMGIGTDPAPTIKEQTRQPRPTKQAPEKNPNKNMPPPPAMGFQGGKGGSKQAKQSGKGGPPPGFSHVMPPPPPGMMIPIGVDPATGKTIHAPQGGLQPPPMNQGQGKQTPSGPFPPPVPPLQPGQNIWNARAEQQQQQQQQQPQQQYRQQPNHQNQRTQNYQQRNHSQNYQNHQNQPQNNYHNSQPTASRGQYVPRTPFVALPPSVPKRGKMMSGGEVATVLHAHMRSLEITDPYREDFYYHHFMLKERRRQMEEQKAAPVLGAAVAAASNKDKLGASSSTSTTLPLPVWQETKEKNLAKKDKLWNKFAENTKEWEEKNKVFGHTQKSNPRRPKALLNLTPEDAKSDSKSKPEGEEDEDGEEIFMKSGTNSSTNAKPFSDAVWGARKSIEDAKVALLAIDELRRLLSRPDIDEIQRNKTNQSLGENFQSLQKALGFNPNLAAGAGPNTNPNDMISDAALLESIAQQDKGKKLLARVFKLLPSQAAYMLPLSLKVMYLTAPVGSSKEDVLSKYGSSNNNIKMTMLGRLETEALFLNAVVAVINTPPIIDPATMMVSKQIINYKIIKGCIESIVKPHISGNTLSNCLRSKQRVEVVQAIMKKGDELVVNESDDDKKYWKTLTKAFLELASKNA